MADKSLQQLQQVQAFQTNYFRRQLTTLEPIVRSLLNCNIPAVPIVKEKIQQAEMIISSIPLELEPFAESWHLKLANWWVEFALQLSQGPMMPKNEEMQALTPQHRLFNGSPANGHSTVSVSESVQENFEPVPVASFTEGYVPTAFASKTVKEVVEPSSSPKEVPTVNDRPEKVPKRRYPMRGEIKVPDNYDWGLSYEQQISTPFPTFEVRSPSPDLPAAPIQPVPNDFDWSQPTENDMAKACKPLLTKEEVLSKRTHIPGTYYNWD